jgi:hypothetical protein
MSGAKHKPDCLEAGVSFWVALLLATWGGLFANSASLLFARCVHDPRLDDNSVVLAIPPCPVHVVGKAVVDGHGQRVYRSPLYRAGSAEIKCSGRTIWVLFHGGVASSQEAYVGVRSGDGGKTWRALLSAPSFGAEAPSTIDAYSGPWAILGESAAYFVGSCPACGYGTVSLTVTLDGGRHFRRYRVAKLTGFTPRSLRVVGRKVVIAAGNRGRSGLRGRTVAVAIR